jgi:hypothetical protein
MSNVIVSWTGGTLEPNSRVCGIRLQYRLGTQGGFRDVIGEDGAPMEYRRSEVAGDFRPLGPVLLPSETADRPLVQLRWKYYFVPTGASGARAKLRLDDVVVSAAGEHVSLQLLAWRLLGDGRIEVRFRGVPGESVRLLTSSDLVDWSPAQLLRATADGLIQFEDYVSTGITARFYRLER